MQPDGDITKLLAKWRSGDGEAFDQVAPAVYDHLHQVAQGYLRHERPATPYRQRRWYTRFFCACCKARR